MGKILSYKLSSIDNVDLYVLENGAEFNISQSIINFNLTIKIEWLDEKETILNHCSIQFLHKETQTRLLKMTLTCAFHIINYKDHVIKSEGSIETSDSVLKEIFSTTVNTARGYMYAKTENTYLHGIFLPTFDVGQFIKNHSV